jgi:hypothetical protein
MELTKYGFISDPIKMTKAYSNIPKEYLYYESFLKKKEGFISSINFLFKDMSDMTLNTLKNVEDVETMQHIYSILTFLVTRYIWSSDEYTTAQEKNSEGSEQKFTPHHHLPKYLGWLWHYYAQKLNIKLAVNHFAVDMCNYILIDIDKPITIENIQIVRGALMYDEELYQSEQWFYKVHVYFELMAGKSIHNVLNIHSLLQSYSTSRKEIFTIDLTNELIQLRESIVVTRSIIKSMYIGCNTNVFFNTIRIYLSGSNKLEEGGIWIYNGDEYVKEIYVGGSAGQSSIVQSWDLCLGIKHESNENDFFVDMRQYMPYDHAKILNDLDSMPFTLYDYVSQSQNETLITEYNLTIDALLKLRSSHMGLVTHYIVKHVPQLANNSLQDSTEGTGGTHPVYFNKNVLNAVKKYGIEYKPITNNTLFKQRNEEQHNYMLTPSTYKYVGIIGISLAILLVCKKMKVY